MLFIHPRLRTKDHYLLAVLLKSPLLIQNHELRLQEIWIGRRENLQLMVSKVSWMECVSMQLLHPIARFGDELSANVHVVGRPRGYALVFLTC